MKKTIADLNALIPEIVDLMNCDEPEIGDYEYDEYKSNTFIYEEDGWEIVIDYKCTGRWREEYETWDCPGSCDLVEGWGEVEGISAIHYDEETDEETDFGDDELFELYKAVNINLRDLV